MQHACCRNIKYFMLGISGLGHQYWFQWREEDFFIPADVHHLLLELDCRYMPCLYEMLIFVPVTKIIFKMVVATILYSWS